MAFSRNLRVIVLVAFLVATFLVISSQAASVAHSHGTATASDQLVKAERQSGYPTGPPASGYPTGPPASDYPTAPPYVGRPPRGGGGYSTYPAPPGAGK